MYHLGADASVVIVVGDQYLSAQEKIFANAAENYRDKKSTGAVVAHNPLNSKTMGTPNKDNQKLGVGTAVMTRSPGS